MPVPQPVEREQMIPARTHPSPQPTNPEGLRPGAPPDLSLVPPAQNQAPQDSSGPMERIPEDQEILNLVNLLSKQYELFFRAWEAQNTRAQRHLLSQAATTQEMMKDIVGREESIHLSQDWIPREDLNALERTLYQQPLDAKRRAPPITTVQTNTSLTLAPHPGHQPLGATPTPEPPGLQHQAQETSYQGPTPLYAPQAPMPPPYDHQAHQMPLPPPPQQQQMARLPPASTQLNGTQAPHHHPYQRPNAPYHQPQPHYQQWGGQRGNYQHQSHFHGSRRSGRNWNLPMANTHRIINVGEFLMRLTRSTERGCGRGRGRGRGVHQ
ncbi:hypothetical protein PTTG_29545 [Puccinia triticina 1-1 BBBD Race 1]|uniref:Uncharacterized protein n=1 Tax=Puccinia triticina (isolate 1-1 / race 1 (BBBD)) TaxID=630390 RepID=A0A180G3C9_PUCT1|nr:hypothetical protein PTTG_29545 [Puccinia triticina 1-1 BBBD Race 1]